MFRVLILVPWERFHLVTAHGVSELIVLEENAKAMSLSTLICTVIPRTELEYECYEPWVSFLFQRATSSTKFHFQQITVKMVVTNGGTKRRTSWYDFVPCQIPILGQFSIKCRELLLQFVIH